MKFVISAAVYPPEGLVAGRMASDLAVELHSQGHGVTVLAPFPSRPIGTVFPGFENRRQIHVTQTDGITVIRLPSYTQPESSIMGRARESWSFGQAVSQWLKENGRDISAIFDVNWPLFAQDAVTKIARHLGIPVVLNIMDIYPESLTVKLPGFVGRLVSPPLRAWDGAIVRRASRLMVISGGMKQIYLQTRHVPEDRVAVIHTWQDETIFFPPPNRSECASHYQVDGCKFTFMYLGNIGPVAGVEHLIRSFHRAQLPNAQLLIVGGGSQRDACEQLARELGCISVRFISDPNAANVPQLQALADVFLLPIRKGAAGSSIPSKLGAYMFSAKPILATVDVTSDTAEIVRSAQCGWVGEPEDESWLAGLMQRVAKMPAAELAELGDRAKACGLKTFGKQCGVKKLAALLCEIGVLR